jgi:hypothetical protein
MGRWARLLNRIRTSRLDAGSALHLCRECCEPFVYPTNWAESGPDRWWLLLRCGSCDTWRDVVAINEEVADFDRVLDEGIASITADADQLDHERLAGEADTLRKALALDLFTAEDFRVHGY